MTDPLSLTDHKDRVLAYISPAQRDLLAFLRKQMSFGETIVLTQDGEPTIIKKALATVKLGG